MMIDQESETLCDRIDNWWRQVQDPNSCKTGEKRTKRQKMSSATKHPNPKHFQSRPGQQNTNCNLNKKNPKVEMQQLIRNISASMSRYSSPRRDLNFIDKCNNISLTRICHICDIFGNIWFEIKGSTSTKWQCFDIILINICKIF